MFDLIPFTTKYRPMTFDPFNEFFGSSSGYAATDITETENAFLIEAEMPGYDKSDIHVGLKDGVLTISAEHSQQNDEKDKKGNYIRRERSWGSCQRSFNVEGVDVSAITAEYVNGVLKVTVPKLPEIQPVQQEILIQ